MWNGRSVSHFRLEGAIQAKKKKKMRAIDSHSVPSLATSFFEIGDPGRGPPQPSTRTRTGLVIRRVF